MEVLRNSWDVERDETLVYLRVYSDGFAEAHSMRKIDFRNIQFLSKQLPGDELAALKKLLSDPATGQLAPEYSRFWGNKDFGYKYDIVIRSRQTYRTGEFPAISRSTKRQAISQATRETWLCDLEA
jgi:hypothetical protein